MVRTINTDEFSQTLRERSIDLNQQKLLVTNFNGSDQEQDLTVPANCNGYGRIRHFRRETSDGWPANPLPIDPARKALGIPASDLLQAQVFQNASCNWRCWYCYVPFSLLAADEKHAGWLSPADLIELYLKEPSRPKVIDLSGGQPDLIPEWIPWMMQELRSRQLETSIYLWSDDNLSNNYFWRYLSDVDRELVASYRNYGKVCCFKGFNDESFAFNTNAAPELFQRQFDLMRRYVESGIDVYGYVTFTTPTLVNMADDVQRFLDKLQYVDYNLPLRVVPLEIQSFSPIASRLDATKRKALLYQQAVVEAWVSLLEQRFSSSERIRSIVDVRLGGSG